MGATSYGVHKHYAIDSLDIPLRELAFYLHRNQNYLTAIDPFKAEELSGSFLETPSIAMSNALVDERTMGLISFLNPAASLKQLFK